MFGGYIIRIHLALTGNEQSTAIVAGNVPLKRAGVKDGIHNAGINGNGAGIFRGRVLSEFRVVNLGGGVCIQVNGAPRPVRGRITVNIAVEQGEV